MAELYFGVSGKGAYFSGLNEIAPPMLGMLFADFVGAYSAMWVGTEAMSKIEGSSYADNSNSLGSFINYGGVSILGNFNGLLITSWMLMYFASAIGLVAAPIYLTSLLSQKLASGGDASSMFRQMNYGVTLSFATYTSAWALVQVEDLLINFFENYDADQIANYFDYLGTNKNEAMFWDLMNHTLITVGFVTSSMLIAGSSWIYISNELNDPAF